MKEVPVYTIQRREDLTKDLLEKIFSHDLVVVRNFQKAIGMDHQSFAPEVLAKNYGSTKVDVVNQDPNSIVMEQNWKARQVKRQIKLKEFVDYMLSHEESHIEHQCKSKSNQGTGSTEEGSEADDNENERGSFDESKNVDFCVNVDIGSWQRQMQEIKKIPEEFMCMSKFDILRFARI